MPLNGDQLEYARLVEAGTRLRLAVVAAWCLSEEPATRDPAAQGHNWLNLLGRGLGRVRGFSGVPIVGYSPAGFAMFASARDAATEAIYWINEMSNYAGIRAAAEAGASDWAQAVAICRSPWDAGHYAATSLVPAGRLGELLPALEEAYPDRVPAPAKRRRFPARAWRWAEWWGSVGPFRGRGRRELGNVTRPAVRRAVPHRWWRLPKWYERHHLGGSSTRAGG